MTVQDDLTPEEKAAFEKLAHSMPPPPALEDRIVAALQDEGLVNKTKTKTMNQFLKYTIGIAASIALFFAANYMGRQTSASIEIDPQYGYMMILKEDAQFVPGDPMEMFEEYAAWMEGLFEKGVQITGQELKDTAWEVNAQGTKTLGSEADTRVTGYFIIQADSEEEALAVVRDNPHLKYGGTIELKSYMNR